jgi:hypothetical protein
LTSSVPFSNRPFLTRKSGPQQPKIRLPTYRFHDETYCIPADAYEAIYSGMPPHGLGRIGELVPITARSRKRTAAADRWGELSS